MSAGAPPAVVVGATVDVVLVVVTGAAVVVTGAGPGFVAWHAPYVAVGTATAVTTAAATRRERFTGPAYACVQRYSLDGRRGQA